MKKQTVSIIVGALTLCAVINSRADVTTNTVPFGTNSITQGNFLQNLMAWGTSRYDSGLTWGTNDLDIATGASYVNQMQWANYLSVTKNISAFYVGAEMENAGIAGTIEQVSGRTGYTISNSGDLRIQGGLSGGYKIHTDGNSVKGGFIQPELRVQKLLPGQTYVEANMYYPVNFHGQPQSYPGFQIGLGAWF